MGNVSVMFGQDTGNIYDIILSCSEIQSFINRVSDILRSNNQNHLVYDLWIKHYAQTENAALQHLATQENDLPF